MVVEGKHIGVYGLIINNEKIVLIKKARGGYKGKLDLPGGGMEHGETPIETLKRELMEEAGVIVKESELLDVTSTLIKWEMEPNVWEDLHHIGVLYTVKIEGNEVRQEGDGIDSNGSSWYPISDLEKNNISPFTYYGLTKLGYKIKE